MHLGYSSMPEAILKTKKQANHRAEGMGGVEGEECGVVVGSRERELISRSNKKILCGGSMNDQIGSEQKNRVRVE